MNIVWFKKDLRVTDHRPLLESTREAPTLGLFIIEDEWLKSSEFSNFHLQFLIDSLKDLQNKMSNLGIPFQVYQGDALEVFKFLKSKFSFKKIYSHEETGVWWTYQRDLKIKKWCQENSIPWVEHNQFAVFRNLNDRNLWNQKRSDIISRKLFLEPKGQSLEFRSLFNETNPNQILNFDSLLKKRNLKLQIGGRSKADEYLSSFLNERFWNYQKGMSSPLSAVTDCSRLSPYISWGNISISEIENKLKEFKQKKDPLDPNSRSWYKNIKSFESRLWWHCHFIQKLETEPEIEFKNVNSGYDGMRENDFNQERFEAWSKGETGFPIVDACMRSLIETGWINFRMRALLISFSSYQLWLHWKKPAEHLARLFTDFEPGIHYSQVQMQSGVTGINTIRIYSANKQSLDQDPSGVFIKTYCPELEGLDATAIHSPEDCPGLLLGMSGVELGVNYPRPIVDHAKAYKEAKEKIYNWRMTSVVKQEARKVYTKHGSRKNSFFPTQHRKPFGNLKFK